jgi:uncharacterized protein (DUF885 family)
MQLTPKQIHEIGLEEVKQIRAEMERVMRATGFDGRSPRVLRPSCAPTRASSTRVPRTCSPDIARSPSAPIPR